MSSGVQPHRQLYIQAASSQLRNYSPVVRLTDRRLSTSRHAGQRRDGARRRRRWSAACGVRRAQTRSPPSQPAWWPVARRARRARACGATLRHVPRPRGDAGRGAGGRRAGLRPRERISSWSVVHLLSPAIACSSRPWTASESHDRFRDLDTTAPGDPRAVTPPTRMAPRVAGGSRTAGSGYVLTFTWLLCTADAKI